MVSFCDLIFAVSLSELCTVRKKINVLRCERDSRCGVLCSVEGSTWITEYKEMCPHTIAYKKKCFTGPELSQDNQNIIDKMKFCSLFIILYVACSGERERKRDHIISVVTVVKIMSIIDFSLSSFV